MMIINILRQPVSYEWLVFLRRVLRGHFVHLNSPSSPSNSSGLALDPLCHQFLCNGKAQACFRSSIGSHRSNTKLSNRNHHGDVYRTTLSPSEHERIPQAQVKNMQNLQSVKGLPMDCFPGKEWVSENNIFRVDTTGHAMLSMVGNTDAVSTFAMNYVVPQ